MSDCALSLKEGAQRGTCAASEAVRAGSRVLRPLGFSGLSKIIVHNDQQGDGMRFLLVFAAAATLGSAASLAADSATPPNGGKGACRADIQKFCTSVPHEKSKIRGCLTEHQADLSDTCKQRVAAWAAKAK